jgi:predicted hydrocarbon binding protein
MKVCVVTQLETPVNVSKSLTMPSRGDIPKVSTPFDIGRFMLLPGKKLCGFLVRAKGEPGALRKILDILAKHKARLKYLAYFMTLGSEDVKNALFFLDLTDCKVSPETLASEVRKSQFVMDVQMIKPKIESLIADSISNPLLMGGERAVIMRSSGYKGLTKGIRERFGSAGEAFLYYNGVEIGIEYGKSHRAVGQKLGITDPARIFEDITISTFNCVGYGLAQIVKLTAKPLYVLGRVYNSFECELGRGATKPYSRLIRGMIVGVLTTLFGTEMTVEETKCIAKGDPYCEFEAKPEKAT